MRDRRSTSARRSGSHPGPLLEEKRKGVSIVWIIPIVAALVAIGIAVTRIRNDGPTNSVVFKSVEGLEAGKTFIKYKDVKIGQVTKIELHDDYSKVMVTARIDKHAEDLMVDDANFWVVEDSRAASVEAASGAVSEVEDSVGSGDGGRKSPNLSERFAAHGCAACHPIQPPHLGREESKHPPAKHPASVLIDN